MANENQYKCKMMFIGGDGTKYKLLGPELAETLSLRGKMTNIMMPLFGKAAFRVQCRVLV